MCQFGGDEDDDDNDDDGDDDDDDHYDDGGDYWILISPQQLKLKGVHVSEFGTALSLSVLKIGADPVRISFAIGS